MKTRNFPEKKNQRRKVALAQAKKTLEKNPEYGYLKEAVSTLESRIVDSALDVRTKINRSGSARR